MSVGDVELNFNTKTQNEKKPNTSGIFMTGINLTNVIIGAGIITLPVSFSNGGFGFSIVLLVFSSLVTHFSVTCITKLLTVTGKKTLPDVLFATTGIAGFTVLSFCQIVYPLLALLSYSIIIADNFVQIFQYLLPSVTPLHDRRIILAIAIFGIILPLSLFRNVSFLDKMSFVSIVCVAFYFIVVVIRTPTQPNKTFAQTGSFSYFRSGIAQALSVLAFAMGCQHVVSAIFLAQERRSVARMTKSTHIAVYYSITIYIIIAICGFISFSGSLNGNMLTDFCDDDILVVVARIAFAITVILSSPLQVVASREGIVTIIHKFVDFSWILHVFVTLVITCVGYAVATQTSDLGIVVSVAGALCGAPLGYALPGLSFLFGLNMGYKPNNFSKCSAYFLIIFGVLVTVIGVVMSFIDSGGAGSRIRYWCTSDLNKNIPTMANLTDFNRIWNI